MAHVTADSARPGMVLAAPVLDRRGRLLIPEGCELTERHVQALKTWGVTSLQVEGDELEPEPLDLDPSVLAGLRDEMRRRMGENDPEHPLIHALFEHTVRRQAERLAVSGGSA